MEPGLVGGFKDYQPAAGPGTLQGTNGASFTTELGREKDYQLDVARQAALAGMPGFQSAAPNGKTSPTLDQIGIELATARGAGITDIAYEATLRAAAAGNAAMLLRIDRAGYPTGALDLIGADRRLPRVASETDIAYSERLRTAWDGVDGHSYAGSHGSLLFALARMGLPTGLAAGAVIIQRTKRYSYLNAGVVTFATHTGWTFDGNGPDVWNQFGIVFGADVSTLRVGTPTALLLDAVVKTWKPAKARYMGCKIMKTGPFWDWPFGVTWDAGGRLWGDGVTTGVVFDIPPL